MFFFGIVFRAAVSTAAGGGDLRLVDLIWRGKKEKSWKVRGGEKDDWRLLIYIYIFLGTEHRLTRDSQKHSAGLTAMTERTLGAKAGHLELLKGGKKNKDAKDGKDKKGNDVEVRKGGSKKFG